MLAYLIPSFCRRGLKNDYLCTVQENPTFQMQLDGTGENAGFDIASDGHKIVGLHDMTDALDVLLDNWTFI